MKTVLVVDEHKDLSDMVQYILAHEDYRIVLAEAGAQVIEKTIQELPDLVLMDVASGEEAAFETARKITTDPGTQHIPVVLLSASCPADAPAVLKPVPLGPCGRIVLPRSIDKMELLKRLRSILSVGTEEKVFP